MAVVIATKYERGTSQLTNTSIEQFYGTSGSGVEITMASLTDTRPRRLISVTVKYSAAASTTVTVTHDTLGEPGSGYSILLNSTALIAQTDYVFQPTGDYFISGNDTVTVVAPLLTAGTAKIIITTEVV